MLESPVAVWSVSNGQGGFDMLLHAYGVATYVLGLKTYAIVAAQGGNGVQTLDLSDPANPVALDSARDGVDGFDTLNHAMAIKTFPIGSKMYALSTGRGDNGIQLMDVSNPASLLAVSSATDGQGGFDMLAGAASADVFTIDEGTYAIVTAYAEHGVQLVNLTDPYNLVALASAKNGQDGFDKLSDPRGVKTFVIAGKTYALVAARGGSGAQLIDVSAPAHPVAVWSATDGVGGFDELANAMGVAIFAIGTKTYGIVTAGNDAGAQFIDLSDPTAPVPVSSVTNGVDGYTELDWPHNEGVTTLVVAGRTYALIAGHTSNGLELIDVSDPTSPVKEWSVADGVDGFDKLAGAIGVATFVVDAATYAIVTGIHDSGLQIVQISSK